MDSETLNPYGTLIEPLQEPLKEPYLGTWTFRAPQLQEHVGFGAAVRGLGLEA